MKLIATMLFLFSVSSAFLLGSQDGEIRLIVRGDDMGSSHTANVACLKAAVEGVVTSIELMPTTPWFPEAVAMLKKHPSVDVGIHLTLTSEWETVKWRPLTSAPSLTDVDGFFYPMIWPNSNYSDSRALSRRDWNLAEIEGELRAQIELVKRHLPQVSHLSGHMGISSMAPEVRDLVERLGREYGLVTEIPVENLSRAQYSGPRKTPFEKVASFEKMLEELTPGTWLFVDHPGLDSEELRATYHIGYEDVANDRQGVTDAMTAPGAKEIIERRGITLVGYSDFAPPH